MKTLLRLYVVKTQDGKYVRAGGGYSGPSRKIIVDKIEDAKIYTKIGPARSRITSLMQRWPEFGCCFLVELNILENNVNIIDMEEVTKKNIEKIKNANLRKEIKYKKFQLEELMNKLTEDERKLLGLKKDLYGSEQ